jgi:predicted nucleic-acid-binding protein
MIAVDTNVLVRLFAADDAGQRARARHLIEQAAARGETVFVGAIVLVELIWALHARYRQPKPILLAALDRLLADSKFEIGGRDRIEAALLEWRAGPADFADYLIAVSARDAGATTTYTFDEEAGACAGFAPVPA